MTLTGWVEEIVNDRYSMMIVLDYAHKSPDPSTQNAAVLVDDNGIFVASFACNEFPRGVDYTVERWERPLKYSVIEHAERNSIYAAARYGIRTEGLRMVAGWAACADCARAIIQAGIVELVTLAPEVADTNGRWGGSIDIGMVMLDEAGVKVTYLPASDFVGRVTPLLRDGKLFLQ